MGAVHADAEAKGVGVGLQSISAIFTGNVILIFAISIG